MRICFGKTCALSALSALSTLLLRLDLGESVRHKRPMRHKSPRSELEGEETGRFVILICDGFSRCRPVSSHVVTSNCQRPGHLKRTHWAHPCSLRSHPLPLGERRDAEHSSFLEAGCGGTEKSGSVLSRTGLSL
jgi:hypothetical protein